MKKTGKGNDLLTTFVHPIIMLFHLKKADNKNDSIVSCSSFVNMQGLVCRKNEGVVIHVLFSTKFKFPGTYSPLTGACFPLMCYHACTSGLLKVLGLGESSG